ncbi:MAG: hypothetical protein QM757_40665 [Paludibaculum sp.]
MKRFVYSIASDFDSTRIRANPPTTSLASENGPSVTANFLPVNPDARSGDRRQAAFGSQQNATFERLLDELPHPHHFVLRGRGALRLA